MTTIENPLPLDPWTASSLLQKAIRRGETDLAQWAASTLHRQRGASIWRRLVLIAFEDVGIGDLALVERVTTISTDRNARASLGSDINVIGQLVAELAAAPKDRSADYLICTAIRNADLDDERAALAGLSGLAWSGAVPYRRRIPRSTDFTSSLRVGSGCPDARWAFANVASQRASVDTA